MKTCGNLNEFKIAGDKMNEFQAGLPAYENIYLCRKYIRESDFNHHLILEKEWQ